MASPSQEVMTKVKNHLRSKNIKLWLPPYTTEQGESKAEEISKLSAEFNKDLLVSQELITACLHDLRDHTIQRLKQNENFKKHNIATLKIKCSSHHVPNKSEFEHIETKLKVTGSELKSMVADKLGIADDLKLICGGRVIQAESSLQSQNVRHNSVVLCLVMQQSAKKETHEVEQALKEVERARKGAELLAKMGADSSHIPGGYDVQIADQKGQALDLPDEEKRSLTVALGLHEKGRSILQRKEYELALLLLLEADKEFKECRAEILTMVDNYAVLCLDIVWCYVCTKNISALPDARVRLDECEKAFNKSYGDSLQRLMAVKGSSGNEIALFVRLYLLQAIVFYHDGNYGECKRLLEKAQGYSKMVITDQDKTTELMTLGLSEREARRALRANMMNVKLASQWAFKQREEHKLIKKQEKEKRRIKKLQKEFGTCADGNPVNIDSYDQLVNNMGFEPELVTEALKHGNNDVVAAIEMIGKNPDQLRLAAEENAKEKKTKIKQSALQKLKAMGFDEKMAKACLNHFSGAMEKSVAYLAENSGKIPPDWINAMKNVLESDGAGPSNRLTKEEEEMVHGVAQDIKTQHDDEYLDITLEDEMGMIQQYLTMISSMTEK